MNCKSDQDEKREAPIHGAVLETILSHVPLIDLVPASQVSKGWNYAVFSSLRHLNTPKPWLIVHVQNTRSYLFSTRAYDPRSDTWYIVQSELFMNQQSVPVVLKSSNSNLLYTLSPSKLSFSLDPLHLTWHHAPPPCVWRTDPIVAAIGRYVIVAGGGADFEDDPLAVEIYDVDSGTWITCQSIPADLKGSSSATWLSSATDDRDLFVMEKCSGVTHVFDPNANTWSGPLNLRSDDNIFNSMITFVDNHLIFIGLIGDTDNVKGVKLWKINLENFEFEEVIGEMPRDFLEILLKENFPLASLGVCNAGKYLYMYSSSMSELVVICELGDNGCKWRTIRIAPNLMDRLVFTCSDIGINDVQNVLKSKAQKLTPSIW